MAADSSKDWRMPRSARSLAHRLSRQPVTILLLVLGALLVAHNYAPLGGSATAGVAGAQTKAVTTQAAAIAAELAGVASSSEAGLTDLSAKMQMLEKRLTHLQAQDDRERTDQQKLLKQHADAATQNAQISAELAQLSTKLAQMERAAASSVPAAVGAPGKTAGSAADATLKSVLSAVQRRVMELRDLNNAKENSGAVVAAARSVAAKSPVRLRGAASAAATVVPTVAAMKVAPAPAMATTAPPPKQVARGVAGAAASGSVAANPGMPAAAGAGADISKQQAVVKAMQWAWKGYKQFSWGHDELHPVSKSSGEWFGLGLTLIDALDTLWLMGLEKEFGEAREWVRTSLAAGLSKSQDVNLFETTIRVLGGLLSTYHLSGDKLFLEKAQDLGNRLMPAFKTRSGIPYSDVNLGTHTAHAPQWGADSSLAEVTTVQLEFKDLARATKRPDLAAPAQRVNELVAQLTASDPLAPIYINADSGRFSGHTVTLGARGDSYYEYLLKQWLQTGRTERVYWDRYAKAMRAVLDRMVRKSTGPKKLTFVGVLEGGSFSTQMDHLVCFLPGTLALAAHWHPDGKESAEAKRFMKVAEELTFTCYQMYQTKAGLAPEITFFHQEPNAREDMIIKPQDSHNLLRPEALEAIFLMYRVTKDPKYREWAWQIFEAFEKWTRVSTGGYSSLESVLSVPPRMKDKMETFFLGETLKYLFLIFSDDAALPLEKWVINTEAHPLPIFKP